MDTVLNTEWSLRERRCCSFHVKRFVKTQSQHKATSKSKVPKKIGCDDIAKQNFDGEVKPKRLHFSSQVLSSVKNSATLFKHTSRFLST